MSINHNQNTPNAPFFIGGKQCRTILLLDGDAPQAIASHQPDALALKGPDLAERLKQWRLTGHPTLPVLASIDASLDHDAFAAQLSELMALKPDAVILSGARACADCQRLDAMLRVEEATAAMTDGEMPVILMFDTETAGFARTFEMARGSKRLIAIGQDSQAIATAVGAKSVTAAAPLLQNTRSAIQLAAASVAIACFEVLSGDPGEIAKQIDDLTNLGFGAIMTRDVSALAMIDAAFKRRSGP